jgi:hypothetical protein
MTQRKVDIYNFPKRLNNMGIGLGVDTLLLFNRGDVFVGFGNGRMVEMVSSVPGAEWHQVGQTSPYVYPMPQSDEAELIPFADVPDEIKPIARRLLDDAWDIVEAGVEQDAIKKQNEKAAKLREAEQKQRDMIGSWKATNIAREVL